MEKISSNSPPISLIEIVETFGKNGEFHKDVNKLSDSIESLVNTLGKKSTNKTEENNTPRTLAGDWKDFKQELKKSLFDDPAQYLGMKENVKKKENEDLKKEASEKDNLKENIVDAKDASKIVDKDQSTTILSDMVDVLKLIKGDKTQLKIYDDIIELKKIIKDLNDISAKTIEPNDEAAKQEDREKLAEAIARRLSDLLGEGEDGSAPGIFDKNKKTGNTPKPTGGVPGGGGGTPPAPQGGTQGGGGGGTGKIIGGAVALSRIAGPAGVAVLIASAVDELAGLLGVNDDAGGKKLKEYPQELDDIQEKQLELIDPFYSKVGVFARAQEKFHSFIGLNETQQAEKRLRVETDFLVINEGIKNLDKNKDLTPDQKKSLLELEAKRQALIPKKTPLEVKTSPPSPARLKEIEEIKAEEELAKKANAQLKNNNSNKEVTVAPAAPVSATPAKVESKASADSGTAKASADSGAATSPVPLINKMDSTPVTPKAGIDATSDKLSRLNEETFNLSQSNNDSSQASPVVMSSNKTINNRETNSIGDKITPYPMYATFDKWQDKRSWGYDHV
jgi:hypothetical protein